MGNWVNWILIIGGLVCVTIELALGAATGRDLALVGASLTIGGVIGLILCFWHALTNSGVPEIRIVSVSVSTVAPLAA